jgi:hypothetical protein
MRLGGLALVVVAPGTTLVFALPLRDAVKAAMTTTMISTTSASMRRPPRRPSSRARLLHAGSGHRVRLDRKVTVRVPGSSLHPMRAELDLVANAHEAPSPRGAFVYPPVYELRASYCDVDPLVASPSRWTSRYATPMSR